MRGGEGGSRISSGFSTSFLQSVRLMRIRRPRLHPPASKSKAFAKVVTFRKRRRGKDRENARNEEQADRRAERERERFRRDGKVRVETGGGERGEGGVRGRKEWDGTRTSLCVSRGGTERLLRGNFSETRDVYRDSLRIKLFLLSTLTNRPVC